MEQLEPKIKDSVDKSNAGILRITQKTLSEIARNSGPLVATNEFQVHYWALVIRLKAPDNSVLDIAFPTVVFNYAQQVTPVHIDFELKDVEAMSNALQPLHDQIAQNILEKFTTNKSMLMPFAYEALSVPLNTLHRHPSGVGSFSGTDYGKNHIVNTGVVFPLSIANETPSFSSIMYNNPIKLTRTEYRIATGSTQAEGIMYRKGRTATVYITEPEATSQIEQYLGIGVNTDGLNNITLVDNGISSLPTPLLKLIASVDVEPNTQFIAAENVTKAEKITYMYDGIGSFRKTPVTVNYGYNSAPMDSYLADDTETLQKIEKKYSIEFKEDKDLFVLSKTALIKTICTFEKIYYGREPSTPELNEYQKTTKKDLVETLLELQYLVYEEFSADDNGDNPATDEIAEMKGALMQAGLGLVEAENATDEQIRKWHEAIFGE
jgi:hypothetical protein